MIFVICLCTNTVNVEKLAHKNGNKKRSAKLRFLLSKQSRCGRQLISKQRSLNLSHKYK